MIISGCKCTNQHFGHGSFDNPTPAEQCLLLHNHWTISSVSASNYPLISAHCSLLHVCGLRCYCENNCPLYSFGVTIPTSRHNYGMHVQLWDEFPPRIVITLSYSAHLLILDLSAAWTRPWPNLLFLLPILLFFFAQIFYLFCFSLYPFCFQLHSFCFSC